MEQKQEGLKRELTVVDVAVTVINISISSGIFLLPALIASKLGNASIVAYVLCGIMFLLVTLCFAEVGSRITTSGGAYAYIEKAFGKCVGFIANAIFWFGVGVMVAAALINAIADMLSIYFPIFNTPWWRGAFFFILIVFFAIIHIRGVKQGMITVKIITMIKIVPLILLIIVGLFHLNIQNLNWQGFPTLGSLGEASLILFFAFIGGENVLNISGEMKNPQKTGPLGLMIGVVIIIIFYSLIQIIAQSTLGAELDDQKAPLAAVATLLLGDWGTMLLIMCGMIAIFGSLNSLVMVFPRVMFAGAQDGLLPKFLSKVHPKYATPHWSIITLLVIGFILAVSGGFKQLLVLATLSMLLLYVGVVLAAIKFRWKSDSKYKAGFLLPGGYSIPVITLIILFWLIMQSKSNEIIGIGLFILALAIIYGIGLYFKRQI